MGAILLFLFTKKTKLLIIKIILDKIIIFRLYNADININIIFVMAFAGVLYIKKIIYLNRKVKDFSTIKAFYNNIIITPNGYLMVFYLKQSQIDKIYNSINIQITIILGDRLYPIAVVIWLFNRDPQPLSNPLFSINNKAFLTLVIYKILLIHLTTNSILPNSYSNYSFYKGAVQYIYNYSFIKSQIVQLG